MSFEPFLDLWDCMTIAEFLISVGLGWAGLLLTLCLKERHILTGIWYLSLRHSLILLSILVSKQRLVYSSYRPN